MKAIADAKSIVGSDFEARVDDDVLIYVNEISGSRTCQYGRGGGWLQECMGEEVRAD